MVKELKSTVKSLEEKLRQQEALVEELERVSVDRERRLSANLASLGQLASNESEECTFDFGIDFRNRANSTSEDKLEATFREIARLKSENDRLRFQVESSEQTFVELERKLKNNEQEIKSLLNERKTFEDQRKFLNQKLQEIQKRSEEEKEDLQEMLRKQQDSFYSTLSLKEKNHEEAFRKSLTISEVGSSRSLQKVEAARERASLIASIQVRSGLQSKVDDLNTLVDKLSKEKRELKEKLEYVQNLSCDCNAKKEENILKQGPDFRDQSIMTEKDPLQIENEKLLLKLLSLEQENAFMDEKIQDILMRELELRSEMDLKDAHIRKLENMKIAIGRHSVR